MSLPSDQGPQDLSPDPDFKSALGKVSALKKTGRQTTPAIKGIDALSTATRRAAAIEQVQEKAALGEQGFE